jgi:LmbE family N-acetylglucosaminyl deacetylase
MQLTSFSDITSDYQSIYLSPHFDDVVYSCSGNIALQARSGQRALVITIFAGIPPTELKLSSLALKMHGVMEGNMGPTALLTTRRKEDACAITHLRADYLWLDHLDAVYRGTPAYYKRRRSVLGRVHDYDTPTVEQVTQDLVALHKRLPGATWHVPLGIGYHVDHQIVFSAAQHFLRHGTKVICYEDFPYAARARALQKRLREVGKTIKPILVEISETLHLRQEAAEMYASQVRLNFGSKEAMHRRIRDYSFSIHPTRSMPLERFWAY